MNVYPIFKILEFGLVLSWIILLLSFSFSPCRIEQELLARVVSEMAPPPPDPTSRVRRSPSSQSLAESSDTEPDLAGKQH